MNVFLFLANLPTELRKEDKIKHIVWSFCLLLLGTLALPVSMALLAVFLIGLIKEIWDKYYGSGFCFYDMMGNFIGMSLALALSSTLQLVLGL
jgi:uncharacterized membrane protein